MNPQTDSTASYIYPIANALHEFMARGCKGKIVLHSDGHTVKTIEVNYFIEVKP